MKKIFALVALSGTCIGGGAFAASYGDAGCGLGSMIFPKNDRWHQTAAATTNNMSNALFLGEIFAISTGTSNCSREGFVMEERKEQYFAEANFESLKVELAVGQGEHIRAFAQVMGCPDELVGQFGEETRSGYSEIVTDSDISSLQMLNNLRARLNRNPELARACGLSS